MISNRIKVRPFLRIALAGVGLCFIYYLGVRTWELARIFYGHPGLELTQGEVAEAYKERDLSIPAPIPKIIHQIFHNWTDADNEHIPEEYALQRQTCIDANPGWENRLWTSKTSRAFLEKEYPWFLQTYDGYPIGVQRVDALRYFLMRHFGGIYLDLDNSCKTSLEPLRYYPLWTTYGGHGTLSNNILGARPGHPFWIMLTDALVRYAWKYPLPYITVSYASGQWFMSKIWRQFHERNPEAPMIRILMDFRPGSAEWVFFDMGPGGGSWREWDDAFILWISRGTRNLVITIVVGVILGVVVVALGILACMASRSLFQGRRKKTPWHRESPEEGEALLNEDDTELRPMR